MSVAIERPLPAPEHITGGHQHFACSRLQACLSATTCIDRQAAAEKLHRELHEARMGIGIQGPANDYASCLACPAGLTVRSRIGDGLVPAHVLVARRCAKRGGRKGHVRGPKKARRL